MKMRTPIGLLFLMLCSPIVYAEQVKSSSDFCQENAFLVDFTKHASDQIDQRIQQLEGNIKNIDQEQVLTQHANMYSSRLDPVDYPKSTGVDAVPLWPRNTKAWTNIGTPLDFTGISGWNNKYPGPYFRWGGATLISPRHFIAAVHFPPEKGKQVGFVDALGQHVTRTFTDYRVITDNGLGTDIMVGVLDRDVDMGITYYPLISSERLRQMTMKMADDPVDIPIIVFNQYAQALIHQLTGILGNGMGHWTYNPNIFLKGKFSKDLISGDSGQPGFLIVDNQPILLFTHSSVYEGSSVGAYISEINQAMDELGGGYHVTEYSPSCFIQYELNHKPSIDPLPNSALLIPKQTVPGDIFQFTAKDPDAGQHLKFSLVKLTSNEKLQLVLNAQEYFSINPDTGLLRQTANLNISEVGKTLKLIVMVSDDAPKVGTSTAELNLQLREKPYQEPLVELSKDFVLPVIEGGDIRTLEYDMNSNLIAAGDFLTVNGLNTEIPLIRFNTLGEIDYYFNQNFGHGPARDSKERIYINKIVSQKDGKILLSYYTVDPESKYTANLLRLHDNGAEDINFSYNLANQFNSSAIITDFNLDEQNIIATYKELDDGLYIGRIKSFDGNGLANDEFNNTMGKVRGFSNMKVNSFMGKVWVGGLKIYTDKSGQETSFNRIAKFDKHALVDQAFTVKVGTGFDSFVNNLKFRLDGKMLVMGSFTRFNGVLSPKLVLLDQDGSIDSNFGSHLENGFNYSPSVMTIQKDNKIIVAGSFNFFNGQWTNNLLRLNADGSLDQDFQEAMQDGILGYISSLALREDGSLAVAGRINDFNGEILNSKVIVLMTKKPAPPTFYGAQGGNNLEGPDAELYGLAIRNALISIHEKGKIIAETKASALGEWSLKVSFTPGVHMLKATQTLSILNTVISEESPAIDIAANDHSPRIVYGDINGDNRVGIVDFVLTMNHLNGLRPLNDGQLKRAEVSGNGQLTFYDAALISQRFRNIIKKFPVER